MNHWLTGFIDWNIVLDSIGGPNHVNNFAAAPVMIDYEKENIYYTPYYFVLKQFSRSMRPGDQVISCQPSEISDQIFVCATKNAEGQIAVNILNTGEAASFPLQIGEYCAQKPAIPASMLPVEPESSRFLAALQRKHEETKQHNADAISFAAFRKEVGSDV
jgi:glucosylceramidase